MVKKESINVDLLEEISQKISDGANTFLCYEYGCLMIFVIIFAGLIYMYAEHQKGWAFTSAAFVAGSLTSIICGLIGMKIATSANYRTAYRAWY